MPSLMTLAVSVGLLLFTRPYSFYEEPVVLSPPRIPIPTNQNVLPPPLPTLPAPPPTETVVKKTAQFMWKNFSVESDQRQFGKADHWQTHEELLVSKKGDCEDFAVFAQTRLKEAGISSLMMNIYGSGYAHTVTVLRDRGEFVILDGVKMKRYEGNSLTKLLTEIYPLWKKAAVIHFSKEAREPVVLKEIQNLLPA